MRICGKCGDKLSGEEVGDSGAFPGLTIAGTLAGGAAAALTGTFALIPLGILSGLGADLVVCELCGEPGEEMFEVAGEEGVDDRPIVMVSKPYDPHPEDSPDSVSDKDAGDFSSLCSDAGFEAMNMDFGFDSSVGPDPGSGASGASRRTTRR